MTLFQHEVIDMYGFDGQQSFMSGFNGSTEDAKRQVLGMISNMTPEQRTNFNRVLPIIEKVAQSRGVDTSALSELQSGM